MPGHCKPILYGHLKASQPHLPALKKTKTEEGVTDLQNKFVIKLEKLYNKSTTPWQVKENTLGLNCTNSLPMLQRV